MHNLTKTHILKLPCTRTWCNLKCLLCAYSNWRTPQSRNFSIPVPCLFHYFWILFIYDCVIWIKRPVFIVYVIICLLVKYVMNHEQCKQVLAFKRQSNVFCITSSLHAYFIIFEILEQCFLCWEKLIYTLFCIQI